MKRFWGQWFVLMGVSFLCLPQMAWGGPRSPGAAPVESPSSLSAKGSAPKASSPKASRLTQFHLLRQRQASPGKKNQASRLALQPVGTHQPAGSAGGNGDAAGDASLKAKAAPSYTWMGLVIGGSMLVVGGGAALIFAATYSPSQLALEDVPYLGETLWVSGGVVLGVGVVLAVVGIVFYAIRPAQPKATALQSTSSLPSLARSALAAPVLPMP
jgi:hypothetical protein